MTADCSGRQWAGIDLSPMAIKLVNDHITEDHGLWGDPIALDQALIRTDPGHLSNYRTHRHRLYGQYLEEKGLLLRNPDPGGASNRSAALLG